MPSWPSRRSGPFRPGSGAGGFLPRGRGIVSEREPLGLTIANTYELWDETDLVIGIGARLAFVEVPLKLVREVSPRRFIPR